MSKPKSVHSTEATGPAPFQTAENSSLLKAYVTDLSWQLAIALLGFSLLGNWLDGKNETKPLFTLVGIAIGSAASILIVRRFIAKNYPEKGDKS